MSVLSENFVYYYYEKPDWWLSIEEKIIKSDQIHKLQTNYSNLSGAPLKLIELTLSSHVIDCILDYIRKDWITLILNYSLPKTEKSEYNVQSLPGLWELPAALIMKPINWTEMPREVYMSFPYYLASEKDRLPPRGELAHRKKYQYARYFKEITNLVKNKAIVEYQPDDPFEDPKIQVDSLKNKVQRGQLIKLTEEEVVKVRPTKKYIAVENNVFQKKQFKKIQVKKAFKAMLLQFKPTIRT